MIRVEKYGGTSVSDINKIKEIALHLKSEVLKGNKIVVVFSAMGKSTNEFIDLINQVSNNPNDREVDQLLVLGEMKSIVLGSLTLNDMGIKSISLSAKKIPIVAHGKHRNGFIKSIDKDVLLKYLEEYDVIFVAGFQGVNENNDFITLGRGGSDTTAVALAKVLDAPCYIYTDVDGVYPVDPKVVDYVDKYQKVPYDLMLEMASQGSGVLIPRSVALALESDVKLYLLRSLNEEGTKIMSDCIEVDNIIGISKLDNYSLVAMDKNEFLSNVDRFAEIKIDMFNVIGQKCSFIINDPDVRKLNESLLGYELQKDMSKISIIGTAISSRGNNINKVLKVLSEFEYNDLSISSSEIAISFMVETLKSIEVIKKIALEFNVCSKNID